MTRNEQFDNLEAASSFTDPAGIVHSGELADKGDIASSTQFGPDVVVINDAGTIRAITPSGEIASGNAVPTIETAIANGEYIVIKDDYTIGQEITMTEDNKYIDALGATFTAGGDHKLWHLDEADGNILKVGGLDLGSSGRVGIDLHAAQNNKVEARIGMVPSGTFNEDDGSGFGSGTYRRCAIRVKTKGDLQRGAYWNNIWCARPWGTGQNNANGDGLRFEGTAGTDSGANANVVHGAKVSDYDTGIYVLGTGNTFFNVETSGCTTGVKMRPGQYGAQNAFVGKAWVEHCGTGIDLPSVSGEPTYQDAFLGMFGFISFAGCTTDITETATVYRPDYVNKKLYMAHMELHKHREGSTTSNPTTDSPNGWLQITNVNGNTMYVPYYS